MPLPQKFDRSAAVALVDQGLSIPQAARRLGVSASSMYAALARMGRHEVKPGRGPSGSCSIARFRELAAKLTVYEAAQLLGVEDRAIYARASRLGVKFVDKRTLRRAG